MFDPLKTRSSLSNESPVDQFDVVKERRWDQLSRPLFIGGLPFLAIAIVWRTVTAILILQAYLLTGLLFGYLLLVEERENLRESWLWRAMAPIAVLHLVALTLICTWDKSYPDLANKGLISTSVLWVFGVIEYYFTLWMVELCRPSTNKEHPSRGQA